MNLSALKTPGVYIDEVNAFPPSVAQVSTIPAFIGYTEVDPGSPVKVNSFVEFEQKFGGAPKPKNVTIVLDDLLNPTDDSEVEESIFKLYNSLKLFYSNGGGVCYVVSAGVYSDSSPDYDELKAKLDLLEKLDDPTLIVVPDAVGLENDKLAKLQQDMLSQCGRLQDRFAILDVKELSEPSKSKLDYSLEQFRDKIGTGDLKYGAAYYPYLYCNLQYVFDIHEINFKKADNLAGDAKKINEINDLFSDQDGAKLAESSHPFYKKIEKYFQAISKGVLPPSGAIAGIYANTDATRGIWKAPANVSLKSVLALTDDINDKSQEEMNVHVSGKAVNAIRKFSGKGLMVWGARTLDAGNLDWRYINVRRLAIMIETSAKHASMNFVFEPNVSQTWVNVKGMLENYLTTLWNDGALAGQKPEHAFFVQVGLGQTMTANDINEGRMIVKIGYAPSRPAEFIVLEFTQVQQRS